MLQILRNGLLTLLAIVLIVAIPLLSLNPSLSLEFTPPPIAGPRNKSMLGELVLLTLNVPAIA